MERDEPAPAPSEDDGDVSLIRWMLSLSAEERLAVLQGFVDSVTELRRDRPRPRRRQPHPAARRAR